MPMRHAIWKVGAQPQPLAESSLASEKFLEEMIVAAPRLLSDEWLLIGRQEDTGLGGRIDLLAIAPDGSLVLIELKRDRTPREVVAQALDYASWVEKLRAEHVAAIYGRFRPGRNLGEDFKKQFGHELDEEALNDSHQIVIVAAYIDESAERIVAYLSEREIPINVLCFQVFAHGSEQFISRVWTLDPSRTPVVPASADGEPWNGEFYSSFGEGESRSWQDAIQYGFICAGGAPWYSRTLKLLKPDDRVWVRVPGTGFVGVGRATGLAQRAADFHLKTPTGEAPVLDVAKRGHYHRDFVDDPGRCEWFVPMRWLETVPVAAAESEIGLFGNQNTVCKPTTPKWRSTVERLKVKFPKWDK